MLSSKANEDFLSSDTLVQIFLEDPGIQIKNHED